MPPRRNGSNSGGAVRGPASALTSFLAGSGVEPPSRINTWSDASALNTAGDADAPIVDPASFVADHTVQAGPTEPGEGSPSMEGAPDRPRKRQRAMSIDSDDLDAEEPSPQTSAPSVAPGPLRPVGEFMVCGACAKRFTVTAYTKEHPKQASTYLCMPCTYAFGIDPYEKPKKAKAKPVKKEERGKITHYEVRKGVVSLGSSCIKLIGNHIEDVDQSGDIGSINMDNVCRIISKSRRLSAETAPLFYSIDRTESAMYDCTRSDRDAYSSLATLCPNSQSLRLDLCGQITTDVISSWGDSSKSLRRIELYGPFLVRKEGWLKFFDSIGARAEGVLITQSPRIDLETVEALVKHCPNSSELRLSEVGQMSDVLLQPLSQLGKLQHLDLSSPGSPLSDDAVDTLSSSIGSNLKSSNSSNSGLADGVLPAIAKYCDRSEELFSRNLEDLSDEAVAAFFVRLASLGRPGLRSIDLEKGQDSRGNSLRSSIDHSGATSERSSVLGWKEVDQEALEESTRCVMSKEVDLGWCREVTDFTIKGLLDHCEQLDVVRVWGCNHSTDAVPRKRGVKVIGIETHAI